MNDGAQPFHALSRRGFIQASTLVATGAVAAVANVTHAAAATTRATENETSSPSITLPRGRIGKVSISRLLLGGNLIGGWMHARDLKYSGALFRAYVTEQKLMETLRLAEQHGINTVFETGADYVQRYNREFRGHLQIIPHIEVQAGQSEFELSDHIKRQVDTGAVALYVWGVSADRLVQAGAIDLIRKAVEMAKTHGLPVGVGGHSLLVPMACEKNQVRKEFIWLDGGEGWYDNMWCINPEETIAFMKTVTKPWLAFKVLAAGAIYPREAFPYAFKNGADFIAVGMFDFQIKENCELTAKVIRLMQNRERTCPA
jgi:hypothetical protein